MKKEYESNHLFDIRRYVSLSVEEIFIYVCIFLKIIFFSSEIPWEEIEIKWNRGRQKFELTQLENLS